MTVYVAREDFHAQAHDGQPGRIHHAQHGMMKFARIVRTGEEIDLDGLDGWVVDAFPDKFARRGAGDGSVRCTRSFSIGVPPVGVERGTILHEGDPRIRLAPDRFENLAADEPHRPALRLDRYVVASHDIVTARRFVLAGEIYPVANAVGIEGFRALTSDDVVWRAPRAAGSQRAHGDRWLAVPRGLLVTEPHPFAGRDFMERLG